LPLGASSSEGVYWSDYSIIGLDLKIPIFTGFGTRARVRQADIELKQVKEDMLETKTVS